MSYRDPRLERRSAYRNTSYTVRPTPQSLVPKRSRPGSMLYKQMTRKEFLLTVGGLIVAGLLFWLFGDRHVARDLVKSTATAPTKKSNTPRSTTPAVAAFDKTQHSLTDPASIWLVVNKHRPLTPKTFVPSNLVVPNIPLRSNITSTEKYVRGDMAAALEGMVADANNAHVHLNLQSGYRSYQFQVTLYGGYVQQEGQAQADRESARPGYSEHQTGMAADLGGDTSPACNVAECFSTTDEGTWLAANAYKYGFIIRYPSDKESVTGYEYEPWHVRYIGTDLAAEMHKEGIETLEEFFGLGAAPSY